MQTFRTIDPVIAREALDYDPETGGFVWKARPRERFNTEHGMRTQHARYAGRPAGNVSTCTVGKTYVAIRIDGVLHYAHRIAWALVHGEIPIGGQIDHIDGDGTNNRLSNLRLVTASENKRNARRFRTNTTGYTGVYYDQRRGTYYARAWINDRPVNLGSAKTAEEAYALRQRFNRENGFHENHGQDRAL